MTVGRWENENQKGCFQEMLKYKNLRKPFMISVAYHISEDTYQQASKKSMGKNPHLPSAKPMHSPLHHHPRAIASNTISIASHQLNINEPNGKEGQGM